MGVKPTGQEVTPPCVPIPIWNRGAVARGAYINKGWGKSKIRFELRRKGLPDSLISQQEEKYDAEDFIDEIIHLVDKKYSSKLDFSDYKSVQRVTAALARRGFAYDDIKLALSRIKDGDYDEEEEYDD